MNATSIERVSDSLEEYGNRHGTEAQLNKTMELLQLAGGALPAEEIARLEKLGNANGTEAQLNEVGGLFQGALASTPDSFIQYPDMYLLLRNYKPEEM
jgi:hypothetical protein